VSAPEAREVAGFLRAHPPLCALSEPDLLRVAEAVEEERFVAGETIFAQGGPAVEHLWVVRSGAVELVADGSVLDVLGEGELFGYASLLSGFAPGFQARAAEQTLCYRIASGVAHDLLAAPEGLRYVARSLLDPTSDLHVLARQPARNLADQPVGMLLHGEPVICGPTTPIREAAERMTAARETSAVIDLGDGRVGILTDRDLRTKVVANGLPGDAPVSEAMSAPAYTASADRRAGDVLLEMLDRGFRHFPVLSATGAIIGVVEDADLVAARSRSSFYLRQLISIARSVEDLATVAAQLRPMVISLHDANLAAANVMAVYSVAVDALTRRLLELEIEQREPPGVEFAWLALGSQARREALPSSDVDSAIVWFGDPGNERVRASLVEVSQAVTSGLQRCGLQPDRHRATASDELFVRSLESWQQSARSYMSEPTQAKALVLCSVLVDSRPVWGVHTGTPVADTFRLAPSSPQLLRMMARFALAHRPPTAFVRGLVLDHSGVHRGRLDLKLGGVLPIVDLARWGGMAAGVTHASTTERLRAAAHAGTLQAADAHTLEDAFRLISNLRVEHQVGQLRDGAEPDDRVDPADLSALMRTQLRGAFRAVSSVQKRLASELRTGHALSPAGAA
jgi:CBS domain-containing protein